MNGTYVTLLNPVDEGRCRTLAKLDITAKDRGSEILLLGAFARDLLFWHMHGIECHRATMDVDIVVQVKSWDAYNDFRAALMVAGFTSEDKEHPEKLYDPATNVEIDLLPFGEIADDGKTVVWPQDNSRWSVVGLQDAYDHALRFEITVDGSNRSLRFVSAPALVLLKMVALADRPEARYKKDSVDISFVIQKYLGIGNRTRLDQPPHADIVTMMAGVDLDRVTAHLLGRDISTMTSESTKKYVVNLLETEVTSRSQCRFTQGLQESLCHGEFSRARTIVGDILNGLRWNP